MTFSAPIDAGSANNNIPAVAGTSGKMQGQQVILGSGVGVNGISGTGDGVLGSSQKNGVHGQSSSPHDSGVWGENTGQGYGVSGSTNSASGAGVWGSNAGSGPGVKGTSQGGNGVYGESQSSQNAAISGINTSSSSNGNWGVYGFSQGFDGIRGESGSSHHAGVSAYNANGGFGLYAQSPNGTAIYGQGQTAGFFQGDVQVTGDIKLTGADCAEHFDVVDARACGPGTVMVIDDSGALVPSSQEYDRRVAGVVSGAGDLRPGLILDQRADSDRRQAVALVGKVCCKAIADDAPIRVGDLITTSAAP